MFAVLQRLQALGLLVEGAAGPDLRAAAFWDTLGVAGDRCAGARVTLVDLSDLDMEPARQALTGAGLEFDDNAPLAVVLVDDYLDPRLSELNRQRVSDGTAWVLARLTGASLWLGPHFSPADGPCWACMAERVEGNRQLDRYLASQRTGAVVPRERRVDAGDPGGGRAAGDRGEGDPGRRRGGSRTWSPRPRDAQLRAPPGRTTAGMRGVRRPGVALSARDPGSCCVGAKDDTPPMAATG